MKNAENSARREIWCAEDASKVWTKRYTLVYTYCFTVGRFFVDFLLDNLNQLTLPHLI